VPTVALTDTQHRILEALCRPASEGNHYATPATNQEIGETVHLSVDAVKAHLRTLYRKFGIEDLPHNQKRARLVELVLEGGYLGAGPSEPEPAPSVEHSRTFPPPGGQMPADGARRWRWLALAAALAVVVLAGLAIAGVFSSDSSPSTEVGAYKIAARGYCRLALAGGETEPVGASAEARARGYLETIETMRGRLESLPPPSGADRALERFREGLASGADFTAVVAQGSPAAGSRAEANVVAELTFAAGQVQAGALGYDLGPDCVAVGDVIAESARNAAAP
jgi:hypothetical protein